MPPKAKKGAKNAAGEKKEEPESVTEEEPKAEEAKAEVEAKEEDKKEGAKDEKEEDKDEKMEDNDEKTEDKDEKMDDAEDDKKDGDVEDEKVAKKGRKKREAPPPVNTSREKRARKAATASAYEPENFSNVDRTPHIEPGQGTSLKDLLEVRESIEAVKVTSPEVAALYKLVVHSRYKPKPAEMKPMLMKFSGFLPKPKDGEDKKTTDRNEDAIETKMKDRASKIPVPSLKKLCDLLKLDRGGKSDKASLVDILLDFLAKPDAKFLAKKGAGKKERGKKESKSTRKGKGADTEDDDDDEASVEGEEGVMPNDEGLETWVQCYVGCFAKKKVSLKHALTIGKEKFGVDLSEKKKVLQGFLDAETAKFEEKKEAEEKVEEEEKEDKADEEDKTDVDKKEDSQESDKKEEDEVKDNKQDGEKDGEKEESKDTKMEEVEEDKKEDEKEDKKEKQEDAKEKQEDAEEKQEDAEEKQEDAKEKKKDAKEKKEEAKEKKEEAKEKKADSKKK